MLDGSQRVVGGLEGPSLGDLIMGWVPRGGGGFVALELPATALWMLA